VPPQAVTKLDNSVANTEDTSLTVTALNTVRYMTFKSELLVNVVESPAHIDRDVPADIRLQQYAPPMFILQSVIYQLSLL
jgi:hypothetical protein